MNLKVKIKTGDLSIVYIDVPDSITLDELVKELVREEHVQAEYADAFPQDEPLNSLFDRSGQLKVSTKGIELTLTKKRGGQKVENIASKLNYQIFLPTVQLYRELIVANQVKLGTTFFVQMDNETYLVRHNKNEVELFDFKASFDRLYHDEKNVPTRSTVIFKTRDELSMSEMAFIRSVSFPVKERKNPIIEMDVMTQEEVNWMTDVLDKVTQIIKHFSQNNTSINRSDEDYPTYVFQKGKPTIGFVKRSQLVKISAAAKRKAK